jgi:hypothetical protein
MKVLGHNHSHDDDGGHGHSHEGGHDHSHGGEGGGGNSLAIDAAMAHVIGDLIQSAGKGALSSCGRRKDLERRCNQLLSTQKKRCINSFKLFVTLIAIRHSKYSNDILPDLKQKRNEK